MFRGRPSARRKPMKRSCHVELLAAGSPEAARLGGKGASLCRLVRLGHRVPPGLVVTREAFLATVEHLGLSPALESLSGALAGPGPSADGGDPIRRRLLAGRIPRHVLDPIFGAVEELRLWHDN